MVGTSFKLVYPAFLLYFGYIGRYLIGIFLTLTGVLFLVSGVYQKYLLYIYFSSAFIGAGNVILYLTMLSFLKHFPTKFLTTYLVGSYSGGVFITVLYFFLDHFHLVFHYVSLIVGRSSVDPSVLGGAGNDTLLIRSSQANLRLSAHKRKSKARIFCFAGCRSRAFRLGT